MPNLPKQIIGSFEDIGKSVGEEIVKVPGDIVGKALESLGAAQSGQKGGQNVQMVGQHDATPKPKDGWDTIDLDKSAASKQTVARAALQALVMRKEPKSKSVWEQLQEEEAQKKIELAKKQEKIAKDLPAQTGSKRPRGDLYGMKAKKASAEMSRNVRQD